MIPILRILQALLACLFALPAWAAFTDNGDGTVTDGVAGLMWDKCSWGQSANDCSGGAATTHTWAQALGVAAAQPHRIGIAGENRRFQPRHRHHGFPQYGF